VSGIRDVERCLYKEAAEEGPQASSGKTIGTGLGSARVRDMGQYPPPGLRCNAAQRASQTTMAFAKPPHPLRQPPRPVHLVPPAEQSRQSSLLAPVLRLVSPTSLCPSLQRLVTPPGLSYGSSVSSGTAGVWSRAHGRAAPRLHAPMRALAAEGTSRRHGDHFAR
jgi:hypothetical protein